MKKVIPKRLENIDITFSRVVNTIHDDNLCSLQSKDEFEKNYTGESVVRSTSNKQSKTMRMQVLMDQAIMTANKLYCYQKKTIVQKPHDVAAVIILTSRKLRLPTTTKFPMLLYCLLNHVMMLWAIVVNKSENNCTAKSKPPSPSA